MGAPIIISAQYVQSVCSSKSLFDFVSETPAYGRHTLIRIPSQQTGLSVAFPDTYLFSSSLLEYSITYIIIQSAKRIKVKHNKESYYNFSIQLIIICRIALLYSLLLRICLLFSSARRCMGWPEGKNELSQPQIR